MSLEELPNYTCRIEIRRAHLGVKAREKIAKQIEKLRGQELGGPESSASADDCHRFGDGKSGDAGGGRTNEGCTDRREFLGAEGSDAQRQDSAV